jgi:predicted lipid carrier protein YhbT
LFADPLPEVDQIARIAGQFPLKVAHPAELLPIGIFHPTLHHILVALVMHLLEQEQPDHQSHRLGRTTLFAVILPKSFFKL